MPKNYEKVLNETLKQITPKKSEEKKLYNIVKKTLKTAEKEAKKHNARVILAGSATRNTWLPGKMEFDVFVLFPTSVEEKKMEQTGLKIGNNIIKKLNGRYKIEYAQHPYVSGEARKIGIEVVPCYEIKTTEALKSAVDRTPFHVRYLEENLPKELSKDVRFLKKFCTVNGIYGADSKTLGFSGYVCELLIIRYRSFLNTLKSSLKWEPSEIIDIEKFYLESEYPKVRKSFRGEIVILIDPTDKKRNTAAAVSAENFYKFKKAAKEFLENPSADLFSDKEYKPITENELVTKQLKRRTELILVKFKPPKVVPDILWPQMRRFADRLESILEEMKYEFKVFRKDIYTNEKDLAAVLLEMEVSKLPTIQKRIGPSIFSPKNAKVFIDKYRKQALAGPYIEKDFWCVEVNRKFLTAREKLKDSLKDPVKILKAKGILNYIAQQVAKKFEIISENDKIMKLIKKDKQFGIFLRRYFEKESLV